MKKKRKKIKRFSKDLFFDNRFKITLIWAKIPETSKYRAYDLSTELTRRGFFIFR